MKLRFWGTRGSIPSPGPDTIKYGGNTTCIELRLDDGTLIIFDAGTGIRNLGLSIQESSYEDEINLFLSHSHWDHIQGFPFFTPANQEKIKINIFGCPPTYNKLREILTNQMESRYFPVNFTELKDMRQQWKTWKTVLDECSGRLFAFVFMYDHSHVIIRQGEQNYSASVKLFKQKMNSIYISNRGTIWQPRFWEHQIRDDEDLNRHVDYIHYNPVKHKVTLKPLDYPYSSFRQFMKKGQYTENWGEAVEIKCTGEPE